MERYKISNRAHSAAGAPRRMSDYTTHPEIGGRVLAPRATRFLLVSELTPRILDDVERFQACGVVSFQPEFGRPVEVNVPALRTRLGFTAAMALSTQEGASRIRGLTVEAIFVDEAAFTKERAGVPSADSVVPAEPAPAAIEEEAPEEPPPETPKEDTKTLADSLLEDVPRDDGEPAVKVFTAEELSGFTTAKLDEILISVFGHDPKQIYKIGNKSKKISYILERQAGTATE